jgi:hypothetical protein
MFRRELIFVASVGLSICPAWQQIFTGRRKSTSAVRLIPVRRQKKKRLVPSPASPEHARRRHESNHPDRSPPKVAPRLRPRRSLKKHVVASSHAGRGTLLLLEAPSSVKLRSLAEHPSQVNWLRTRNALNIGRLRTPHPRATGSESKVRAERIVSLLLHRCSLFSHDLLVRNQLLLSNGWIKIAGALIRLETRQLVFAAHGGRKTSTNRCWF